MDFDQLFDTIATLVLHHSPSGMETEIDRFLLERFQELGLEPTFRTLNCHRSKKPLK
jgi:putative aminopeptidase FrvX